MKTIEAVGMIAFVTVGAVILFAVLSNHNIIPRGTVTGMTADGIEVQAEETCIKGHLFFKNYGAVIDDVGAPVPCIFGRSDVGIK